MVSAYALLLMAEAAFWNIFGFDREATQVYFLSPIHMRSVFLAKNFTAFLFVCAEIVLITLVCTLIGMRAGVLEILEAFTTTLVLAINLFAVGNQSSVRYPISVNPDKSWANTGKARFRFVLMVLFPLVSLPTVLAYGARYAFDSELAFYLGMLIASLVALSFYAVSLDSSIQYARNHREDILNLLSTGEGLAS
jgi:ABC-2 type transport system permease protein